MNQASNQASNPALNQATKYPPGLLGLVTRVVASKPGAWFVINVSAKVDPFLLKSSNGRLSSLPGQPVLLLQHVGAKSGQARETPLVFALDGDDIVLIASKGGSTSHPAWFHNLTKTPLCQVVANRRSGTYLATMATGDDRDRLWAIATKVYAGYDTYQARTEGREIPVMRLRRQP